MTRYTYAFIYSQGGDTPTCEIEVEVSYVVRWGAPERGPTYACGGTPADPDEIDDIRLEKVEGKPRPWDVGYGFISDDEFEAMAVEELDSDRHERRLLRPSGEARMTSFEVRNARTNRLVRTFGDAKGAMDFATAHSGDVLGQLQAFEVETIRRERLLTGESEISVARARLGKRRA